jgi:Mlc titration factor MtfA (ptsG expression regulator)
LDEIKRLSDEMVAYAAALPAEFIVRKASYFQVANMLLEGSLPHITSHIDQIQAALATARKK